MVCSLMKIWIEVGQACSLLMCLFLIGHPHSIISLINNLINNFQPRYHFTSNNLLSMWMHHNLYILVMFGYQITLANYLVHLIIFDYGNKVNSKYLNQANMKFNEYY